MDAGHPTPEQAYRNRPTHLDSLPVESQVSLLSCSHLAGVPELLALTCAVEFTLGHARSKSDTMRKGDWKANGKSAARRAANSGMQ